MQRERWISAYTNGISGTGTDACKSSASRSVPSSAGGDRGSNDGCVELALNQLLLVEMNSDFSRASSF